MWDPIAYALGFIDCDKISARCMLTIFMLFAIRTEASVLRMLDGRRRRSSDRQVPRGPRRVIHLRTAIRDIAYETGADGLPSKITSLQVRNELREFDVVCACDLPGVKKVLPKPFRQFPAFDNIYELDAVPIATVQLRFDGWVTELGAATRCRRVRRPGGDARASTTCSTPRTRSSPASRTWR
ncbi:GTPase [Aureococcus anophagefferens]|nr:GTPase [Aureococcus anophagefferens]